MILSSSGSDSERDELRALFPETEALDVRQFSTLHRIILGLEGGDARKEARSPKVDINHIDSDGRTALSWAAKCGKGNIVTMLVEEGADPCLGDPGGRTPLHRAVAATNPSCIVPLLQAGATVDSCDFQDSTVLHYAASQRYDEKAITSFFDPLLDAGANINSQITSGHTALHIAIRRDITSNALYLIGRGANMDICDGYGTSGLMYAVECNRHIILEVALQKGADCLLKDNQAMTIMHYAAAYGDLGTLQILVRWQHSLESLERDARRHDGLTPVDLAAKREDVSHEWIEAFGNLIEGDHSIVDTTIKS